MKYGCLCGTATHIIRDTLAGEQICKKCGVVLSSGAVERNQESYASSLRVSYGFKARHVKRVRQLETILDRVYASGAIKAHAVSTLKKIIRGNLCRKCDQRALAIAIVMISCKIHGKIVDLCDIIENSSKKRIQRIYRSLVFDLEINLNASAHAKSIITMICSTLKLERFLDSILQHANATMADPRATGINPRCIVGYCVYRATKKRTTLKTISGVLSVSKSCISRAGQVYQ